jgi:hypothetical protein
MRIWEQKPEAKDQLRRDEMREKIMAQWRDKLASRIEKVDDPIIDITIDQRSIRVPRTRPATCKSSFKVSQTKRHQISSKIVTGTGNLV